MNIYKVSRVDIVAYDEYDSFIAVAESEEAVRTLHPSGDDDVEEWGHWSWVELKNVGALKVVLIGTSLEKEQRVVLSSFNAG